MKINKTSEGSRKTDISGIIYLGIMVVMVMCCRPAWSDTWFVATNGSDATGSGSDASPWLTISNAIGHSVDNDTVVISSGIYALDDQLVVTNGITLRTYNNDRAKVVINGNNYADKLVTNRCLFVNHTNAFISGLTFSNGVVNIASAFGGGAILIMTNGTVSNCIITWSKAADGGGVYMNKGGLLLNSLISYNFVSNSVFPSGRGGGIYINTAGTVVTCRRLLK